MDDQNSLKNVRAEWEKGLTALTNIETTLHVFWVVLKDARNKYHCHRYFELGKGWAVDVVARTVGPDEIFKILNRVNEA